MLKREIQYITQAFNKQIHRGVDLRCVDKNYIVQPAIAAEKSKVYRLSTKRGTDGYGNHYIVYGNDDYTFKSIHVYPRASLFEGQELDAGQEIGTPIIGGNSFALHEHFEVWKGNEPIDPEDYFIERGVKYEGKGRKNK